MNVCMDIFEFEFCFIFCYIYFIILFNGNVLFFVDKIIEYEFYNIVELFVLFKCFFYVL